MTGGGNHDHLARNGDFTMAFSIAVANRKGGVGKSTVSVMLAQAYAVWGKKRVLVLDLDAQCNTSLILLGGEGWKTAKDQGHTITEYFEDQFDGVPDRKPKDYLTHDVGDVVAAAGRPSGISVLCGSLFLEDIQNELLLRQSRHTNDPRVLSDRVRGRIEQLLMRFQTNFDVVVLDCAPGLSAASMAAIKMASKVIVPYRPDYVSQFAVDRIAQIIEGRFGPGDYARVDKDQRRYLCLANYFRNNGRDAIIAETIEHEHPALKVRIPPSEALADAFDFIGERVSIEEKYGKDVAVVKALYDEMVQRVYA